jgi:putative hydrolase of the HAD superfamily
MHPCLNSEVPLLLLDLDNTLIDRDAAFRAAAADLLAAHGLPAGDLDWLMEVDASGYAPRSSLAAAIGARYGGRASAEGRRVTPESVRALTDSGAADRVVLAETTAAALASARGAGWRRVIVTNGRGPQQLAKIRNSGLDALVDAWIISGDVGLQKPDPAVFAAAAEVVGASLDGAWMIGDSPRHDIGGAHAAGIESVWVRAGTAEWTEPGFRPTHIARDAAAAIRHVVGAPHA